MTPPTGPVFISLPGDILNMEAGIDLGASTRVDTRDAPLRRGPGQPRQAHAEGRAAGDHRRRRDRKERRAAEAAASSPRCSARPCYAAERRLRRAFPLRASLLHGRADARSEAGARRAVEVRPADRARRRSRAHVGVERGRAAAARPGGRADRPRRLGDGQELSGRDGGPGRRARDAAGADAGAVEAGRRAACRQAPRQRSPSSPKQLDGQARRHSSHASRAAAGRRRSTRTG